MIKRFVIICMIICYVGFLDVSEYNKRILLSNCRINALNDKICNNILREFHDGLMNHDQKVKDFMHLISDACMSENLDIPISVAIAQSVLETGFGEHAKNNNYFGIKTSDNSTNGAKMRTKECVNGSIKTSVQRFRKYASLIESMQHHANLLNSVYLIKVSDSIDIAIAKLGRYASDPDYARKLHCIIDKYNLTLLDDIMSIQKFKQSLI